MERVIENNRLITEFMGYKSHMYPNLPNRVHIETEDVLYGLDLDQCLFHSSWDKIIPVYRKMRDFLQNMERPSRNHCCKGDMIELDASCALTEVNIEGVYKHIVDFINWHNELLSTDKTKTV